MFKIGLHVRPVIVNFGFQTGIPDVKDELGLHEIALGHHHTIADESIYLWARNLYILH